MDHLTTKHVLIWGVEINSRFERDFFEEFCHNGEKKNGKNCLI